MKNWEGKNILVMSPTTHYWLGRCKGVDNTHIHLEDTSWIPDVGLHHAVIASGKPDEHTQIAPHPDGVITSIPLHGSVVIEWPHKLWREPK